MKQKYKATLLERKALTMAAALIGPNLMAAKCFKVVDMPKGRGRFWWSTGLRIFAKFVVAMTGGNSSN